jgi:hypothetical protein
MAIFVKVVVAGDVVVMVPMPDEFTRVIVVMACVVPHTAATVAVAAAVAVRDTSITSISAIVVVSVVGATNVNVVAAAGEVEPEVACLCGAAESRKRHNSSNDAR